MFVNSVNSLSNSEVVILNLSGNASSQGQIPQNAALNDLKKSSADDEG